MRLLLDIISVAAFVMSLASWLYTFHVNRKKVALSIEHCWFEPSANIVEYQFRIVITNLSRLPLAVTHLSVEHSGQIVNFETGRYNVLRRLALSDREETLSFPVNIAPLLAVGGYAVLCLPLDNQLNLSKPLTVQVHTSRGTVTIEQSQPAPVRPHRRK